jgi:hypothetical protein
MILSTTACVNCLKLPVPIFNPWLAGEIPAYLKAIFA